MTDPNGPEQPQRLLAEFDEPDPEVERLFISLGRAVTAAAAMEQALQIYAVAELVELYEPTDPRFLGEMTRFLKLTGGQVCNRMQKLGLAIPEHLAPPIDDAIDEGMLSSTAVFEISSSHVRHSRTEASTPSSSGWIS